MVKLSKQSITRLPNARGKITPRGKVVFGLVCVAIFSVISIRNLSNAFENLMPLTSLSLLDFEGVQLYCDKGKVTRHSSRHYTAPDVPSIFNCDGAKGLCKYFYPANFFDAECGIGRRFHHLVTETENLMRQRKLWPTGPQIGFHTLVLRETGEIGGNADVTDDRYFDDDQGGEDQANEDNGSGDQEQTGEEPIHQQGYYRKRPFQASQEQPQYEPHYHDEHGQVIYTGENHRHKLRYRPQQRRLEQFAAKFNERLSFIHVHKAGGTSVYRAGQDLYHRGHAEWIPHHWFFPRKPLQIDPRAYKDTQADLKLAVRYPKNFDDEHSHILYAVVRDPVERFISSIGQVMGSRGSENELAYAFRAACLKETPRATLACCLDYVEKAGYWFELHFAPQALDIAFTTLWQDVPVAVFGMEHLNDILEHLGHKDLKARDGNDSEYRPDHVLTEMSVKDYDGPLLRQVCRMYEVDVIMLRSLGMKTRCDRILR